MMDEVFGPDNCVATITFKKTPALGGKYLDVIYDNILYYAKNKEHLKYRQLFAETEHDTYSFPMVQEGSGIRRRLTSDERNSFDPEIGELFRTAGLTSQSGGEKSSFVVAFEGKELAPSRGSFWKTNESGMRTLARARRLEASEKTLSYARFQRDFRARAFTAWWDDTIQSTFATQNIYVVQTYTKVVQRCLMMATDPGDLVLDPTCGSGTTAYVAEQWGRRWITIDTSRVALALARARIMGARYPFYLLADSAEGQKKEAQINATVSSSQPTHDDIRQGFVYERVPHITLKSIANNAEIDVIWEEFQETLEPLREELNGVMAKHWQEWEVPREAEDPWESSTQRIFYELRSEQKRAEDANPKRLDQYLDAINHNLQRNYSVETLPERPADPWPEAAQRLHAQWWEKRVARQKEIDLSIAAKAEFEYLYDKPYEDKKKVRVAGPFTVESLSPHRVLGVDENDELIDDSGHSGNGDERDFVQMILNNLKTAGVQQAHKDDKINFTSLTPWPGYLICAEGRYHEGGSESAAEKRAAVFIGPEFGTVSRPDLVAAAREAGDADFDVLITCAFNYDAHSSEFKKLGRIPVLKARMNADLHMSEELKNTGKGNLFVIFGEPDIDILEADGGQLQVKINGVDVFHPNTGEVRSDGAEGIACWFIDTDYNEESFFVRHAYFLGANDPYKSLKTTLKAEINEEAWATLNSGISRPFDKPESGRIAVKVINHLGDEVMKVFRV